MVLVETVLQAADNTQARRLKCIHLLVGGVRKQAGIGDFIVVAIRHRRKKRRLISRKIYLALIVGVRQILRRPNGSFIMGSKTKAVLLSEETGIMLGSRIYGPVYWELKYLRLTKSVFIAKRFV